MEDEEKKSFSKQGHIDFSPELLQKARGCSNPQKV
jgi:hypothetical protein